MGQDRVSVVVDDLTAAGEEAGELATSVGNLSPGSLLREAAGDLPGADSVATLGLVATQWENNLLSWCTSMNALGDRLGAAASGYQSTDQRYAGIYPGQVPPPDLLGPPGRLPASS